MCTKTVIKQKDIEKEFNDIFEYSISRFREGAEEHGDFNPETDSRNDFKEILDELSDSIIYISMFIMKLKRINTALNKIGYTDIIKKRQFKKDK